MKENTIRITVDEENNAEQWWDAAQAAIETCPAECRRMLVNGGVSEMTMSEATARAFLSWAEALPGWSDPEAPAYARHPLTVHGLGPEDMASDRLGIDPL